MVEGMARAMWELDYRDGVTQEEWSEVEAAYLDAAEELASRVGIPNEKFYVLVRPTHKSEYSFDTELFDFTTEEAARSYRDPFGEVTYRYFKGVELA